MKGYLSSSVVLVGYLSLTQVRRYIVVGMASREGSSLTFVSQAAALDQNRSWFKRDFLSGVLGALGLEGEGRGGGNRDPQANANCPGGTITARQTITVGGDGSAGAAVNETAGAPAALGAAA